MHTLTHENGSVPTLSTLLEPRGAWAGGANPPHRRTLTKLSQYYALRHDIAFRIQIKIVVQGEEIFRLNGLLGYLTVHAESVLNPAPHVFKLLSTVSFILFYVFTFRVPLVFLDFQNSDVIGNFEFEKLICFVHSPSLLGRYAVQPLHSQIMAGWP